MFRKSQLYVLLKNCCWFDLKFEQKYALNVDFIRKTPSVLKKDYSKRMRLILAKFIFNKKFDYLGDFPPLRLDKTCFKHFLKQVHGRITHLITCFQVVYPKAESH